MSIDRIEHIGVDDVESLSIGAWILGTGGGGSPYLGRLNLERLLDGGRTVPLVDPSALDDDALVAVVSNMGAPLVGQERLVNPSALAGAVRAIERVCNIRFDAVMAVEIGGGNALAPWMAAACLDLPVVDADAMGRAFPEAQMTSFAIGDLSPAPVALVDCRGNEAVVSAASSWRWMERMCRALCTELGSTASTCKAPRRGDEIKQWGIHGTVTKAVLLGRVVLAAREAHADPVRAVVSHTSGELVAVGKVVDVDRVTTGGFLRGTASLETDRGDVVLSFRNEWAVAAADGHTVATTPDLLCLLEQETGEAIGTETVRYGQRVALIAMEAPAVLRTVAGLAAVGPRAFGYDIDHVSLFRVIRIGIDVGGTNTDAVLVDGRRVVAATKQPTSDDVFDGVATALRELPREAAVDAVIVGTTQFTNAIVERRRLERVGVLRVALPASASLPPTSGWPGELRDAIDPVVEMVGGGHEVDGREFAPLDEAAVLRAAARFRAAGVRSVAVSAQFSPLDASHEVRAAELIAEEMRAAVVTCSHQFGQIGLLERESVAILNASLQGLARRVIGAIDQAVRAGGLDVPFFLTANDGTIVDSATAAAWPVHCIASGPTNSMRGAALLSGISEAVVVDVGGTTTDLGVLVGGFPRMANSVVTLGGVRTLFRMPDVVSLAIGGGTILSPDGQRLGPESVGKDLSRAARVFGGPTVTLTDLAVAKGIVSIGNPELVSDIAAKAETMIERVGESLSVAVDRVRTRAGSVRVIAAGGGAFLVPDSLPGVSEVVRVEHADVANAVGAAIADVAGRVDRVYTNHGRAESLAMAEAEAGKRAVDAGADREHLELIELDEVPLAYLAGDSRRVRATVVGPLSGRAVG